MSLHRFYRPLVNYYQNGKHSINGIKKLLVGIGICSGTLAVLPYQIQDNKVVSNVNGILRFSRFVGIPVCMCMYGVYCK